MASSDKSYEADRELWRKLYKTFVFNNDSLDQVLEDQSLYWNDDKEIVDTFVLKTIKRFEEKQELTNHCYPSSKMTNRGVCTPFVPSGHFKCRLLPALDQ